MELSTQPSQLSAPPATLHIPADRPPMVQLLHLTWIEEDAAYVPLTEAQALSFIDAGQRGDRARCGLIVGGVLSVTAAAASGGLALGSVFVSDLTIRVLMAAGSLLCGACSPLTGCLFGGYFPHQANEAYDRGQDQYGYAQRMYTDMAQELQRLATSHPERARQLVNKLKINDIRAVMVRILGDAKTDFLIHPLVAARASVLDELELPHVILNVSTLADGDNQVSDL